MHVLRYAIPAALGALAALLLARLVLQLLAARPDNPVFAAVRAISAPLIAPLTWLDAGQPRFGAVLEWSTLALLLLVVGVLLVLAGMLNRHRRRMSRRIQ